MSLHLKTLKACHFGHLELALELIKLGASPNNCNRNNKTALDLCKGIEFRRKILGIFKIYIYNYIILFYILIF